MDVEDGVVGESAEIAIAVEEDVAGIVRICLLSLER